MKLQRRGMKKQALVEALALSCDLEFIWRLEMPQLATYINA